MIKNGVLRLRENTVDYIQFGNGKKDLVIIPGLGDGIVTVKGKALIGHIMLREFCTQYRVTMFSRKNYLESNSTTRTMARDQAMAMKKLGIRKAHVVGISQGGMIAQHLAADYPEMIDRLVLVVTIPCKNEMIIKNAERWKKLACTGKYKELMIDINEQSHVGRDLKKIRRLYPIMGFMGKPKDLERFLVQANACESHDARAQLSKITAPTFIIGGELDVTLGCDGSRDLAKAIPNSKLYLYPHYGHALYEDAKDFKKLVLDFITETE